MTDTNTSTAAATLTSIEALNRQWEQANAAYTANAEAHLRPLDKSGVILAERGETLSYEEAKLLHTAILYQRPRNWRDALILAVHLNIATDPGCVGTSEDEAAAMELASAALATFISDQADTGEPMTGWTADNLRIARLYTEARTRVQEAA